MGKVTILNTKQKLLLDEFSKDPFLSTHFYFTGGTALSLYYLQHRESVDLDFFSREPFDPQDVIEKVASWKEKYNCTVDYTQVVNTHIFQLTFSNSQTVKIDFVLYPHRQVKESKVINGIAVDSLMDIAVNKLLTVEQRSEVKDFVDLYFLLKEFTIWDLMEGVKVKFKIRLDPMVIGSDFLKVEDFEYLPKMIKDLDLETLKSVFRQKAKELSKRSVE